MKCFRILCSLVVLLLSLGQWAVAGNPIRGFLVDATSSEPLPVANVVLEGTNRGAFTNLDGYFVLDHLLPGEYILVVSHLGYHSTRVVVRVREELMEPIRIELVPEAVDLGDAVITLEKEKTRLEPVVSNVPLETATIKALPALGAETDVLRAIQTIPGVKALSEISSGIYVRGGSPDQTLILMDHNVVYNPSHLFGIFSTFNADATKRVDLMKGGFPAEYGGRSGSVLEIITNEGNRKEFEGMVSIGILSARAAIEGPLPDHRGSYALSGRRTYFEPILSAIRNSQNIDLPDYYFYDGNGKINLDLSDKSTLLLAGYWGNDRLDIEFGPDNNRGTGFMTWGNRTFTGRLRRVLSKKLFFSINGAVSKYRSAHSFENQGVNLSESNDRLLDYSLKMDLEIFAGDNHRISTGISSNRYDFALRIANWSNENVDVETTDYLYSGYVEDSWRIGPFFEVKPGIRGYYYDTGEYSRLDPRLALVYHYDATKRFKVAGGRYSQFISLLSFGESLSQFDVWIPIDESVSPSYSDQIVLGFEWDPKPEYEFTVETYYTDMKELVEFNQIQTEEAQKVADAYLTGGKGYAYGFEVMLNRKEGRWTGWLGYSLSWTRRRFEDTYLNNGDWFYPIWDRRHDLIAVANYALSDRWELSGIWRFHTGQGYTQPLGVYAMRYSTYGYDRNVLNGGMNNYRFPADHRLDVSATYKHTFLRRFAAKLNLGIYNLYSYRSYWRRSIDTDKNPVKIEDIRLLPILPMISYEVRF
jgi:hypothetical protein